MFAVVKNGGKQYSLRQDQLVHLEKLDLEVGTQTTLNEVIMINNGTEILLDPAFLGKASVSVEVVDHGKNDKVLIFKKRRRKNYRRKTGHRQHNTLVRVLSINHP